MKIDPKFDAELLEKLYQDQPYTVDQLAHTEEERILVGTYNAIKGTDFSTREIYVALLNMRKRSKLSPKGRRRKVT